MSTTGKREVDGSAGDGGEWPEMPKAKGVSHSGKWFGDCGFVRLTWGKGWIT